MELQQAQKGRLLADGLFSLALAEVLKEESDDVV